MHSFLYPFFRGEYEKEGQGVWEYCKPCEQHDKERGQGRGGGGGGGG